MEFRSVVGEGADGQRFECRGANGHQQQENRTQSAVKRTVISERYQERDRPDTPVFQYCLEDPRHVLRRRLAQ